MIRLRADLPEHMNGWEGQEELWKEWYDHDWIPEMKVSVAAMEYLPNYITESLRFDEFSANQTIMAAYSISWVIENMPPKVPDNHVEQLSDLVKWLEYWGRQGYGIEAYE